MNSALVVRLGSLGDVVHTIPAAAALRRAFPHARIDWVTAPQYLPLIDLVTVLDHRIGVDTRALAGGDGLIAAVRGLRRSRYDVVLDFQGLLKSAVLARAVGARRTIGFPRADLREPLARAFYTDMPDPAGAVHIIEKNLALLSALDVADRAIEFPLRLAVSRVIDAAVRAHGTDGFVLLNPGAAWPNKRWPAARFGAVAAAIHRDRGMRSIVLWGPGDEALATAVVSASAGFAALSPPTAIPDIAALARAARLMVSGDTGPLHLGAAVGTPIVSLFGPTRPERNGPWSPADEAISRVQTCDCVYERKCRRREPCIDDISVDEVLAAIDRRLSHEPGVSIS